MTASVQLADCSFLWGKFPAALHFTGGVQEGCRDTICPICIGRNFKKNDLKSKNAVDAVSGIWSKGRPAAEQQTHSDI
jgi:hypothetical protein